MHQSKKRTETRALCSAFTLTQSVTKIRLVRRICLLSLQGPKFRPFYLKIGDFISQRRNRLAGEGTGRRIQECIIDMLSCRALTLR